MPEPVHPQPASRPTPMHRLLPALLAVVLAPFPAWAGKKPKGAGAGAGVVASLDSDPEDEDPGTPAGEASEDAGQARLMGFLDECLNEAAGSGTSRVLAINYVAGCTQIANLLGLVPFDPACRAELGRMPLLAELGRLHAGSLEVGIQHLLETRTFSDGGRPTSLELVELRKRAAPAAARHSERRLREQLEEAGRRLQARPAPGAGSGEERRNPVPADGSPVAVPAGARTAGAGAGAGAPAVPAGDSRERQDPGLREHPAAASRNPLFVTGEVPAGEVIGLPGTPGAAERIAARPKVRGRRTGAGAGAPAAAPRPVSPAGTDAMDIDWDGTAQAQPETPAGATTR